MFLDCIAHACAQQGIGREVHWLFAPQRHV